MQKKKSPCKPNVKTVLILIIISVLFTFNSAFPQKTDSSAVNLKKEITRFVESTRSARIYDFQVSPDRKIIAFTVSEPVKDFKTKTNIWLYDLSLKKAERFTGSHKSDSRPRWTPDGEKLMFLSNRNDKRQIYQISLNRGEAGPLTKSKTSIRSFELSSDGKYIAFLTGKEEEKKKDPKDDAFVEDYDETPSVLKLFEIKTEKTTDLITDKWHISEYRWIPGQNKLIVSATQNIFPELLTNNLYILDIKTKKMELLITPPRPFSNIKISPDCKKIAFLGARNNGPDAFDIFITDFKKSEPVNLTINKIDHQVNNFIWIDNNHILASVQSGFTNSFYKISVKGKAELMGNPKTNPSGFFCYSGGKLLFTGSDFTEASEIYISEDFKSCRKISSFNAAWDTLNLIEPEIIRYKSFDGKMIEASLYKPAGFKTSTSYPAVINVHGGPSGRFAKRLDSWAQVLAKKGFVVLCPNIRGSSGYGYDFMAIIKKDWGGIDFKDVIAGADYIVSKGIADKEKLGIGGWSYGGYMSAWAVTQTNIFKAAVSGAPVIDLAVEYGSETPGINSYDTWYLGTPYENLDDFIRMSPITYVKNVKTPTLILCGENDVIDPIAQCSQFYRGLKRYGVETRFVRYPRENHGFREKQHRIDVLYRMLMWFDKYLK